MKLPHVVVQYVDGRTGWMRQKPTSEGRFHGSLHHADEQLQTLRVLGEAGGECCKGVCMTTQVLQGNPLTKVGLQGEKQADVINSSKVLLRHF